MRQRQKGVTFIGWLFLLAPLAVVAYACIRLTPLYLNYMKVAKAVSQTATEYKGEQQINPTAVRASLQRRYDVDSIDFPDIKSITVMRDGQDWVIEANYEDTVKLFAGLSLLVHFDKRAVVE